VSKSSALTKAYHLGKHSILTTGTDRQKKLGYTDEYILDRTNEGDAQGRGMKDMLLIPSTDEDWEKVTRDGKRRTDEEIEAVNDEYEKASKKLTWLLRCEMFRYLGEEKELSKDMLAIPDGFFSFEGILNRMNAGCRRDQKITHWALTMITRFSNKARFQIAYRRKPWYPKDDR
jgi:hypothetical protein